MEQMHDPISPFLRTQGALILDGGLATELEARGFVLEDELWSARLLRDDPAAIREVHRSYLEAGADCVISASYQASVEGFCREGATVAEAERLLLSAIRLAREARDEWWARHGRASGRRRPLVAASIGPYGATLADGSEYRGRYGVGEDALAEFHRPRLQMLAGAEADLLACETIPSGVEARVLSRLLGEIPGIRAWMSFSCGDERHLRDGTEVDRLVNEVEPTPGLLAVGVNCTAPAHVAGLVRRIRKATEKPIVVYPNSGETWDEATRTWSGGPGVVDLARLARRWRRLGASCVGGCCRVGPREIRRLREALVSPSKGPDAG